MDLEKLKKMLESFKSTIETKVKEAIDENSTEQGTEVTEMKTRLDELNSNLEKISEQIKSKDAMVVPGLNDELKKESFSWSKFAFAALASSKGVPEERAWEKAGYEKEILDTYAKIYVPVGKDAIAGDGSQGGYLVPEEVTSEIVDMTIANMPLMKFGVNELRGLHGDLPIPRQTDRNTGYWVGETEAPTESSNVFGEFTLRPKKAGAFTKMSRRLSYQTKGTADAIIKKSLSQGLALTIHNGLLQGTGSDKQPLGILNVSGMTTTPNQATNGARFRVDKCAAMTQAIDVADELLDSGKYAFLMRPEVLGGLRRERVPQFSGQAIGQGMPLSMANILMSKEELAKVIGYPLETTTQLSKVLTCGTSSTCSDVIYGNWQQFYVGFWRGFEIRVSDQASDGSGNSSFLKDQFFMVAFQEVDSNVGRATAFTKVSDAETNEANW